MRLMSEVAALRRAVELAEIQQGARPFDMIRKSDTALLAARDLDVANDNKGSCYLLQFPDDWYASC